MAVFYCTAFPCTVWYLWFL